MSPPLVYQEFRGFCYGEVVFGSGLAVSGRNSSSEILCTFDVIFYSSRVLCVKGGILCFKSTVMLYPV
jgi:hypothetical protein